MLKPMISFRYFLDFLPLGLEKKKTLFFVFHIFFFLFIFNFIN